MTPSAKLIAAALIATATALLTTLGPARADQWQPLRDDPVIHEGLTAIAVGRMIHNICPDVNARMLRALAFAEGLVEHAQSLGFTRRQINAYIDNAADQDRYRDIAWQYLVARGVEHDDVASVCRVGRDEMAAGSAIGRLLRGG